MSHLEKKLNFILDKVTPLKKIPQNMKFEPWITDEVREGFHLLNNIHRKFRRTGNEDHYKEYDQLKTILTNKVNDLRSNFYKNRITNLDKPHKIWKELRHLGLVEAKTSSNFYNLSADTINEHFIAFQNPSQTPNLPLNTPSFKAKINEEFKFSKITAKEIETAVTSFTSTSVGVDGLPVKLFSLGLSILMPTLVHIFNLSINSNTFLNRWKEVLIMPVNKISRPQSPTDFRPIALLCLISKVFEKTLHNQITKFLETNNLLDNLQCGFRKRRNPQVLLAKLLDDITSNLEVGKLTFLILFDFKKAFDSVSHGILLNKLKLYGFSADTISWFKSYLLNRKQAVINSGNNSYSKWENIKSGVPQSSILGPLLFLVFINDIKDFISNSNKLLFADDLQIYLSTEHDNIDLNLNKLTDDIIRITNWAHENQLGINLEKTKATVFGPKKHLDNFLESGISIQIPNLNINIPFVKSVKNLGIIFDHKLKWDDHIIKISNKIRSILYRLRYFKNYVDLETRKQLVMSLIMPTLIIGHPY